MLFNSVPFLVFFTIVVAAYFLCPFRWRWALLLIASYFFYMQWEPKYAILIVTSTVLDYVATGMMKGKATKQERRPWLYLSLAGNLGVLFFFKYYNWFNANLSELTGAFLPFSDLLLPAGISFYTLQSLSYTIDVYRGRIQPEDRLGVFATYVAYFPQLMAGPIERAGSLIPQLKSERRFDSRDATDGLRLMAWGMFKKVCIADRLAPYCKLVFEGDPNAFSGPVLATAAVLFCFQVYCDFSGYSDIAIGAAQVMGVRLTENFRRPFFARSIEELWSRWHISLVAWLRDYVYQPLAYASRRASRLRQHLNVLIVFLITGLWHGASWKFVMWGAVNGLLVLAHALSLPLRAKVIASLRLERIPRIHAAVSIAFTLWLFSMGAIFFAAKDLDAALIIFARLPLDWNEPHLSKMLLADGATNLLLASAGLGILLFAEVLQEKTDGVRSWWSSRRAIVRWALSYALVLWIMLFGVFEKEEFVYFQF